MKNPFKFYKVGGCVRDKLLNLPIKDIDYAVVYQGTEKMIDAIEIYNRLLKNLETRGYTIFLSVPSCFTVRAKSPKGEVADFVLARKELFYKPDTREPVSIPGTIDDDLMRRDFTCNAIAEDEFGIIHDPFNGLEAIKFKRLTTPISAEVSFDDDPLRIIRAIRFHITKGFTFDSDIYYAIKHFDMSKMKVVSGDRIREELQRCFKYDTLATLYSLHEFENLENYIFKEAKVNGFNIWLKPTNEL
jgi:tRNA nucleotidyltransferase/poly(A) polymerase